MVTPSIHLFDLYTLLFFVTEFEIGGFKPSIAPPAEPTEEATFNHRISMPPGDSIHVTGVKSLQVHAMISTCVDVDTRRKGPI